MRMGKREGEYLYKLRHDLIVQWIDFQAFVDKYNEVNNFILYYCSAVNSI